MPASTPTRRRRPAKPATARRSSNTAPDTGDRLQKVLAAAGIDSRRQCEALILAGRVEVDGKAVTKLGTKVDRTLQEIRVDGTPLPKVRPVYYALNKPPGVVSTNRDPSGRSRVIDLIEGDHSHLFPVGRLDAASEGLIVVTNDGELANRLTHPRYGIEKTYLVQVAGIMRQGDLVEMRRGMYLAEAKVRPVRVRIKSRHKQSTMLEIVLDEGRNREIRRLLAKVGHKVMKLRRVAIGPLRLGKLMPGESRRLKRDEVRALMQAADSSAPSTATPRRKKPVRTHSQGPKVTTRGSKLKAPGPKGTTRNSKGTKRNPQGTGRRRR